MNIHGLVCSNNQTEASFLAQQTGTRLLLCINRIWLIVFSVCEWAVLREAGTHLKAVSNPLVCKRRWVEHNVGDM